MQIFAGSPRRYEISHPSEKEIKEFRKLLKESDIYPVYVHANYPLNLASEDEMIRKKSLKNIEETLKLVSLLGLQGLIYHPGSPKGGDKKKAILREIGNIKKVLANTPADSVLILENTAGEKKIGTNPREVGYIFGSINSSRLRVCVDTAHSFEAGNITNFSIPEIRKWISSWEKEVGACNISLLHINDSATTVGSQHDRHENIGNGHIGRKGFTNLISVEKARNIPWILEVPGFDGRGPDKKNVDILKKIRRQKL